MKWVTILCLSPALGWTGLSFMAYRDLGFAFHSSLAAWLISGILWVTIRLNFARSGKRSHASEKAKIHHRHGVAIAGVVVAVSLGIFVLTALTSQWLGKKNKPGKGGFLTALRSGTEPSKKQKLQPPANDEPKSKAATEQMAQSAEELWSVQVAAFKSEQDAVKLATALKDRGYKAYVIRAEVNAVNLYRTKVGRFRTREEAERLLLVLKDKEAYISAFVARM